MAEPFKRSGRWYARVKDAAGLWRNVTLPEARTKARAQELAADLALKSRRQRDGLEPAATDRSLTVHALLRWWLDTYVAGKTWASREEDRFRLYFESTDLVRLPVAALTTARLELFLQHWTHGGAGTVLHQQAACDGQHGLEPSAQGRTRPRSKPGR